ncbi:putative cysteine desulfurase [Polystyrenella longa]|uniref:cysteine desulfurase n=1 Tax=Polystyrenella longa TaxID=2528007 RepID=A0A518CR95_9PLAN|nr:aminotransferase class V-fold PLP-dependent enzyme [Polystyrenella longa]QDU81724.1 putative cysteine desulfurase [Polystyrenella longa]
MTLYFDNAATSFPKPDSVYDAMNHYNRALGVAVGRGHHRAAGEVNSRIERCRQLAAQLFNIPNQKQIIFTFNGTDSLNLALRGVLRPGDHVITSVMEHNSVLRTVKDLEEHSGVEVSWLSADETGLIQIEKLKAAFRPNTRLVALIHASNVTGTLQPVEEACSLTKERGALFLLDAAQTAGQVPIDIASLPIDFLACPGHKGLLGPLGTGLLYINPEITEQVTSLRTGGTGTNSEEATQPTACPEKYESGNHNAPGLLGLTAGLEFLKERTIADIRKHETELMQQLQDGLLELPGLTVYGPHSPSARTGVLSLNLENFDPQDLSVVLDETFEIQTRSGYHCAPGAHQVIGSFERGGTLRLSPGPFTTSNDIETVVAAFREITSP